MRWVRSVILVLAAAAAAACAEGSSVGATDGTSGGGPSGAGGREGSGGSGDGGDGAGPSTSSSRSSAATSTTASSSSAGGDGGQGPAGSTGSGPGDQACPPGDYLVAVDAAGVIECAPFGDAAVAAFASGCSVYFGFNDSCDGCTTPPAKWGYARTDACANGAGVANTCTPTTLGSSTVQLFGLNADGDVNDDDKFYTSLHCTPGDAQTTTGPCPAGSFVSGVAGGVLTCAPASGLALGHVRATCSLYAGWIDGCGGCSTIPSKWGRVNAVSCGNGAGLDNTCTVTTLGGESVQLFGLNTDGDVNEDDKFHLGLACDPPASDTATVATACPAGMLVTGIAADGTLSCATVTEPATAAFRDRCTAYLGWRDSCSACTDPPTFWGSFRDGACTNGAGGENTCVATTLGSAQVQLLGVATDGDVGDDDKFHVGLRCE